VWWGSCHEQQGAPPYWLWVKPIRSYILNKTDTTNRAEAASFANQHGLVTPDSDGDE